jgi:hypothetical protein
MKSLALIACILLSGCVIDGAPSGDAEPAPTMETMEASPLELVPMPWEGER